MDFVSRILWRLKWILVAAIFIGPGMAYFSYRDSQHIEHIIGQGALIEAVVTGGHAEHHRSSTDYYLNLAWNDQDGVSHENEVQVSDQYGEAVVSEDRAAISRAAIRYLASEPDRQVAIVDDARNEMAGDHNQVVFGLGAGIVGLLFAPFWFWMDRRAAKKQQDLHREIDAIVAEGAAKRAPPPPAT